MGNFRPIQPHVVTQVPIPGVVSDNGNDPSRLHAEVKVLRDNAYLAQTLMGGTPAMRSAGESLLPRMRHEDTQVYQSRLKVTVLRNFYRQSLTALVGKLMKNGLSLDLSAPNKGPAAMKDWLLDLDSEGTSGDVLFKRVFTWSVRDAASYLIAAYPATGGVQSLADEREGGIRPWLIPLSIMEVLGWREEKVNGKMVVSQFRYMMTSEEPVGLYGTMTVQTIRVYEPLRIYDLRMNAKGDWEQFGPDMINTLGRVPVHRISSDMDEAHRPRGGMADLAWLNLEHWQLRSDQRLTMRINSFPILFASAMEDLPPIGPQGAVVAQNPLAKLSYVESGGSNLAHGRQEIMDLEDAIRSMSALYQARQMNRAQQTATGVMVDVKEANAPAQGWATNAKRGFESAMDDMAELAGQGKGPGAGGTLRLDTDALVSSMDANALTTLTTARQMREISRETFLAALKRADMLPDDFDPEHDAELLAAEPPPDLAGLNAVPKPGGGAAAGGGFEPPTKVE